MIPPSALRRQIVRENAARSEQIIRDTPGAMASSTFFPSQLPVLLHDSPLFPNNPASKIRVVNSDSFVVARNLIQEFGVDATRGKLAVLNLANCQTPGGGYLGLSTAQVGLLLERLFIGDQPKRLGRSIVLFIYTIYNT